MHTREVQLLTPDEIIAEREKTSLIYLPLAPLEWHGPHLPLGVDPLRAYQAAKKLAGITGGLVLPTLFLGTERERSAEMLKSIGFKGDEYLVGMDFPENSLPSLYFKEEVFALVLRNYLELLSESWRFKNIVVVNGHGAENQLQVISRLVAEFNAGGRTRLMSVMPMLNFPDHKWSHASLEETETLMADYPNSVQLEKLPKKPQPLYNIRWAIVDDQTFRGKPARDYAVRREEDPRDADPIRGRKVFNKTIADLAVIIKRWLGEKK